jgi:hypothetical protein
VLLNRTPNQFPDRRLEVEIRVARNTSRLQLFLNGEPEGEFVDPIPSVPKGSGIAIICNTRSGGIQEVSNLEILELDESRGRHRSEERGDSKEDSLISREDDRWSGRLQEIRKTTKGPLFLFKSDFQEEPLEIPEADVSTVFFAVPEAGRSEKTEKSPFILRLSGGGFLQVASCVFDEKSVSTEHPLLGTLTLSRDGIAAIERVPDETADTDEP